MDLQPTAAGGYTELYRRREHGAGGSSAPGHIGRCPVKTGAGASTNKTILMNVNVAIFDLSVFSSIFHMAIPVPLLLLPILSIDIGRESSR